MPRPPRNLQPGGFYHVFNRGVDRLDIFEKSKDRRTFIGLMNAAASRYDVKIHAFCLMGNHYHLLVELGDPNLDRFMHGLTAKYVRYFNDRVGRDGPLFRSRYGHREILGGEDFLGISRYIHRNPIDLGVNDLVSYRWSSLSKFSREFVSPPLRTGLTLDLAGGWHEYLEFVTRDFGLFDAA